MNYLIAFAVLYILVFIYNQKKALAPGVGYQSKVEQVPEENVSFFFDRTFIGKDGTQQSEQEIFDEVFRMIRNAKRFILIDMFLFNNFAPQGKSIHRKISKELSDLLIEKKKEDPGISITVTTDVINTVYGGHTPKMFRDLEAAGVHVVFVNLSRLRDPNPIYGTLWRMIFQWFGNTEKLGLLPHPFTKEARVTLRSYLRLLNMKANHRKVIIADTRDTAAVLVTSANPHDGSSRNTNIALKVTGGDLWCDVLEDEELLAEFSASAKLPCNHDTREKKRNAPQGAVLSTQALTEGKVRDAVLKEIDDLNHGEQISIVMFYLSHTKTIDALLRAAKRGAQIRIILDPTKDAFGYKKTGVPNRSVATNELVHRSSGAIKVRWYDTHGEQCHAKFIHIEKTNGENILIGGSTNLTKRSLDNYNLETSILVRGQSKAPAFGRSRAWFDELWNNTDGRIFTLPFDTYRDTSLMHHLQYKFMEMTGLGTF